MDDYSDRKPQRPFGDDPEAWLSRLPDDAGPLLEGLSPDYFRPTQLTLEPLGRMHGTGWQSSWAVADTSLPTVERVPPSAGQPRRVRHDSRGSLRGFPIVKASPERARSLDAFMLAPWFEPCAELAQQNDQSGKVKNY